MCDENELPGGQRARVRTEQAVFPHEHGLVPAVKTEPVIGFRNNVHQVPPVPVKAPVQFKRGDSVKRRVQHPADDRAQVRPLQIAHETPVQFLSFRRGRFAFRRACPYGKMRAVQHAVFPGQHGRSHLVIGGKFPQNGRIVPALAQHGVRVRQRGKPAVQFSEKHARVLARCQFRGKFRAAERLKRAVRHKKPIRHEKTSVFLPLWQKNGGHARKGRVPCEDFYSAVQVFPV